MNNTLTSRRPTGGNDSALATVAAQELQIRIRASQMGHALVEMACELCIAQVEPEEAFQRIQDRAMEKMVAMLDTGILTDDAITKSCLELVVAESERIALEALEKGNETLRAGLDFLDQIEFVAKLGPVN
ncbi:MAG TPA: hypothetical protein VF758_08910 [Candidatus Acidoferrum sp.]